MFKLIAIRPLKGCGDHIRKCLIEGRMYYFCNDFVITVFENLFPKVRNKKSDIHKNLNRLFVKNGFDAEGVGFPKDKLIEAIGVKVCPYCNRVFVENIEFKAGGSVKGQLDHFYPKDKYPYLAISRYNLVPCCPFCNGSSGKGNKDPRKVKMVNPYSLKDTQGLMFKTNIRRKGFLNLETCAGAVDVEVDVKKQSEMINNKVFHLAEIYNRHKDYVAEMWYRYNMMKTPAYQQFAKVMMGKKAKRVAVDDKYEQDRLGKSYLWCVYGREGLSQETDVKVLHGYCNGFQEEKDVKKCMSLILG